MKIYEARFTFTPDDDSAGEGVVTVSADSEEQAQEAVEEFLGDDLTDLEVQEIREIAELPEHMTLAPRTLQ